MHSTTAPKISYNFRPPCFFKRHRRALSVLHHTQNQFYHKRRDASKKYLFSQKQHRHAVKTFNGHAATTIKRHCGKQFHANTKLSANIERIAANFHKKLPSAQNHGGNCNRGKCFYLLVRRTAACAWGNYSMQMECVLFSGFSLGTTISKTPLLYFALMAFSFTSPR